MSTASASPQKSDLASSAPTTKIHALTSARFFAALYVVFFHSRWGVTPGSTFDQFLSVGYSSVCFFFLLSGYVLGAVYLRMGKSVAPRSFYVARFARIYPLYFVSVLADTPFAVLGRVAKYGLLIAFSRVMVLFAGSVFMLQMWLPTDTVVNIPSWSLAIEAVFYLSFPFLGPLLWKLGKRALLITGLLLYIISVLLDWILVQHKPEPVSGLVLPSYIATFAIGILLVRWQALNAVEEAKSRGSDRTAWLVFACAVLGFACVVWASPWLTKLGLHFGLLLAPVFAASIWLLSSARILPVRLLNAKVLVILGEASYGLYLVHVPVSHLFRLIHLTGSARNYPLYLATCIGLSLISFYFFETPVRLWILHRFRSRTKETMEAASVAG
jgi:peptidoglycan/LPS O-acetylase OafA/YrhL